MFPCITPAFKKNPVIQRDQIVTDIPDPNVSEVETPVVPHHEEKKTNEESEDGSNLDQRLEMAVQEKDFLKVQIRNFLTLT